MTRRFPGKEKLAMCEQVQRLLPVLPQERVRMLEWLWWRYEATSSAAERYALLRRLDLELRMGAQDLQQGSADLQQRAENLPQHGQSAQAAATLRHYATIAERRARQDRLAAALGAERDIDQRDHDGRTGHARPARQDSSVRP